MKTISKENKNLLLKFILSAILVKIIIELFELKNNSVYVVIVVSIIMFLIDRVIKNKKYLKNKTEFILLTLYGFIISMVIIIQNKITFNGEVGLSYLENTFSSFEMIDIIKFLTIFISVLLVV